MISVHVDVLYRNRDVLLCVWLRVIDLHVEIDLVWHHLRLLPLFPTRHHLTKLASLGIWHAQKSWPILFKLTSTNALGVLTAKLPVVH